MAHALLPREPVIGVVREPSGRLTTGKVDKSKFKNYPADYIAKDVHQREGSFDPVCVPAPPHRLH